MTVQDLVSNAIDELYSIDPDEFLPRRTVLAAAARKTDKEAGKQIAALRKPTRSAYVLNQLVRSDPEVAARLADLGGQLLAAQDALDGSKMRELSTLRRGLVEELADQAFSLTGQRTPPPAVRDEVVSTLNAAVADERVVEQLRTGTLLRSARWDGFGFASPPELSVVRPTAPRQRAAAPAAKAAQSAPAAPAAPGKRPGRAGAGTTTAQKPTKGARAKATQAAKRAAEAAARAEAKAAAKAEEQRRRTAQAQAQQAVREADAALEKATRAEGEQQTRVRHLHEQLTDSRRRLDEIRIDVRRAENRLRKAQQAL
ncbi:MAG: hypothetical protein M3400_17165, partial [Actinomycetota bacterium]|nr:hypothetical protein [Actinomycetota bacterium]